MKYSDIDFERKYLITVLTDTNSFKKVSGNRVRLAEHLFSVAGHKHLATLIDTLARNHNAPLSLEDTMKYLWEAIKTSVPKESTRNDYLTLLDNILNEAPDGNSFDFWFESLSTFSKARQVHKVLTESTDALEKDNLIEAEKKITDFRLAQNSTIFVKVGDVVNDYMDYRHGVEDRLNNPDFYKGIKTGFKLIDDHPDWQGTYKGEFYMCLGFTKRGKSFFLLEVGYQAAMRGYNVVHATIEMSEQKAKTRFYSRAAGIPANYLKAPKIMGFSDRGEPEWKQRLTEEHLETLDKVVMHLRDKHLVYKILSFNKGCTVADIEAELKNLSFNPDVLIIDHLPDMKPSASFQGSSKSWDAIGDVSWEMCQLARNWKDQQGLIVWSANQVKAEYEYAERLTVDASAYSKLPVTHASGTVYLTQTEEDERMNVRRFGIINARDSADVSETDYLVSNLAIGKLHDDTRMNDPQIRQYLRRLMGERAA